MHEVSTINIKNVGGEMQTTHPQVGGMREGIRVVLGWYGTDCSNALFLVRQTLVVNTKLLQL